MPEGHVIHRLADNLTSHFAGKKAAVSSPQGRFAAEANVLTGQILTGAQAWGKHLFIDFENQHQPHLIHIHLGLIGKLKFCSPTEKLSTLGNQIRLLIANDTQLAGLTGPQTCRLIDSAEQQRVLSNLGADPLRDDSDPQIAWRKITRSSRSIAALLMDQKITAGVGNIYRAEVLFRHRIDPNCLGKELSFSSWENIWADLVALMKEGVKTGRIDTVYPQHLPENMGRAPRKDAHGGEVYVYRRAGQQCLVCSSPIKHAVLQGRNLYWCAKCQTQR